MPDHHRKTLHDRRRRAAQDRPSAGAGHAIGPGTAAVVAVALIALAPQSTLATEAAPISASLGPAKIPTARNTATADPAAEEPTMGFRARRLVQAILRVQGHYDGPLDGVIGRGTRQSIRRYQIANGFPPTSYLTSVQILTMFADSKTKAENLIVTLQKSGGPAEIGANATAMSKPSGPNPSESAATIDREAAASTTSDPDPKFVSSAPSPTNARESEGTTTAAGATATIATARDLPAFVSTDGKTILTPSSILPSTQAATIAQAAVLLENPPPGQTVAPAARSDQGRVDPGLATARPAAATALPPAELAPPEPKPEPETTRTDLPSAQRSAAPLVTAKPPAITVSKPTAIARDRVGAAAETLVTPPRAEPVMSMHNVVRSRTGIAPFASDLGPSRPPLVAPGEPGDAISRVATPETEASLITREKPMHPSDVGVAFDARSLAHPTDQAPDSTAHDTAKAASPSGDEPATVPPNGTSAARIVAQQARESDARRIDIVLESPSVPAGLDTVHARSVAISDNLPGSDTPLPTENESAAVGEDGGQPATGRTDATARALLHSTPPRTSLTTVSEGMGKAGSPPQESPILRQPIPIDLPAPAWPRESIGTAPQITTLPDPARAPAVVAPPAPNPGIAAQPETGFAPDTENLATSSPDTLAPDVPAADSLPLDVLAPDALAPGASGGSTPLRGVYSGQDSDTPPTLSGNESDGSSAARSMAPLAAGPATATTALRKDGGEPYGDGWLRDLNGVYTGYMEDPDLASEIRVKTRFRFVGGELVGQFSALVNGRTRRGRLSGAKVVGPRTIEMSWRHLWDSGPVRFHFSHDLLSFNGQWGHDRIDNVAWVGVRR